MAAVQSVIQYCGDTYTVTDQDFYIGREFGGLLSMPPEMVDPIKDLTTQQQIEVLAQSGTKHTGVDLGTPQGRSEFAAVFAYTLGAFFENIDDLRVRES